MIRFAVADNGMGIHPNAHEQVFEIFHRLNPDGDVEGTGIGLGFCKQVIERHDGRIWVESAEGAGATFCFTLPRAH